MLERETFVTQEPWHNLVLKGDVSEIQAAAVAYVPLPQPLPLRLDKEFIYNRPSPDGKSMRMERRVFRSLLYRGESFMGIFDAVLNKQRTGFFVLLPNGDANAYAGGGGNLVILSSNALWLMTTSGEIVEIQKEQSLLELPSGFFREHPSMLPLTINMKKSDPVGKKFFSDLEETFPRSLVVHRKIYSARSEAEFVAKNFTAESHIVDRLISCGSATGSLAMLHPIGLAISAGPQVIHNARVIMRENCDQ
jgi:hypothetical protein